VRAGYGEKVLYLPHSYQINDRGSAAVPERFSRPDLGLPPAAFVFCCLNSCYKITAETFASWMGLLAMIPDSVLWLLCENRTAADNLRAEAERRGVRAERLVFAPTLPAAEHLARYHAADLFLDTFPCGAHTTASDALWCGLPLVTMTGKSFVARVAASLLKAVGLPELITTTRGEYEALAIALARDPARLAAIRQRLREKHRDSVLFNTELSTRHLECAYRRIYERHHAGLPPDDLQVEQSDA
jgi:predicted O-linked N-acetylglucosamine transferase (SPINDLY family)